MLHLLESMTCKRQPLYKQNMTIVIYQMSQASWNTRKQPFPALHDLLPNNFRKTPLSQLPQCFRISKQCPMFILPPVKRSGYNLYKPSQTVITVCTETEKCFQRMLNTSGGKLPHGKGIVGAIAVTVLGAVKVSSLFTDVDDHMYDCTVDDNYVHELIREIVNCYCKVQLYHMGKEYTAKLSDKNIREQLTKLILFNHQ